MKRYLCRICDAVFDPKFFANKRRYVLQCLLATASVLVVLEVLASISNTAVIAALGASSFIVFALPHTAAAAPRSLVGGYFVGMLCAVLCCFAVKIAVAGGAAFVIGHEHMLTGAGAVGLSIFIMAITNTEHPPAAGLALGVAFDGCQPLTLVVVALGAVGLSLINRVCRPYLINLL